MDSASAPVGSGEPGEIMDPECFLGKEARILDSQTRSRTVKARAIPAIHTKLVVPVAVARREVYTRGEWSGLCSRPVEFVAQEERGPGSDPREGEAMRLD